ncbi:MAG: hypothetical protein AB8H86_23890 [Polyangiales bacterium]
MATDIIHLLAICTLFGCIPVPEIATERDGGPIDAPCGMENQTMCEGGCANTVRDPNNCGECGNVCDLNEDCLGSQCISDRPLEFLLEWENRGDVDLHVVRPDGVLIYFGDPTAVIGDEGLDGALDVDDRIGTGPERVSFSVPAAGEYSVCVNNFGNIDPTTGWTLRVREDDVIQTMTTGTIGARRGTFDCTDAPDLLYTFEP